MPRAFRCSAQCRRALQFFKTRFKLRVMWFQVVGQSSKDRPFVSGTVTRVNSQAAWRDSQISVRSREEKDMCDLFTTHSISATFTIDL